jgi:hypothetical protein
MASSTTSPDTGFLSSPRAQRRLLWVSGGVFAAGLAVFISVYVLRGSSGIHSPITNKPAQLATHLTKAPAPPEAFKIARQFIETAVQRKNLDSVYPLVGPALKGGMTREQWDKGNIAVMPYLATNTKTTTFLVDWSYKTQILMEVDLVAKPGTNTLHPHLDFYLGLKKMGGKNGHWVVNYWLPHWMPPVPMNMGN